MARTDLPLPQIPDLAETERTDAWWSQPLIVFLGLMAFVVYSTWAAFQGEYYWHAGPGIGEGGWFSQYLSPMYSPVVFSDPTMPGSAPVGHAIGGAWPEWLPKRLLGFIPLTPALFILWAPGGFRFTCYYYRGAYYKAFWGDPMNCGVGEPSPGGFRGKNYRGERWFPLVFHNIHRYFLYLALIFILILSYDAILSYIWVNDAGEHTFGIGVGSLIITLNVILLGGYTLGCHSLRHLIGGNKDCLSTGNNPAKYNAYKCVTCLNASHMKWAWASLIWVGFTDFYVRMCSMGKWTDIAWVLGG